MRVVSDEYKQAVYNKGPYALYARHFIPQATIKLIDVTALGGGSYTSSSEAFYSRITQLQEEGTVNNVLWGTLEDFQFLCNSTAVLMPDDTEALTNNHNHGYVSETMSNGDGVFTEDLYVDVRYLTQKSSIGRTITFDDKYDSVPSSFDIIYYRGGVEIARDEIRNNTSYVVTSRLGVTRYDRVVVMFYETTRPYRRVHWLNDFPGITITFTGQDIISVNVNQSVDVYGEEIITGETDIVLSNMNQLLDILNQNGFEKYLQKKQPVDLQFTLIFPEDTSEVVSLGTWYMFSWNASQGVLQGSFTLRDSLDKLSQETYIKGTLPSAPRSLYSMAEEVFQDLNITDYMIDDELKSIYSTACLPLESHRELLRMIAQAGCSVVLATPSGGYHIKYIAPFVHVTNKLNNSIFANNASGWTLTGETSTEYFARGLYSAKLTPNTYLRQTVTIIKGHVYYMRLFMLSLVDLSADSGSGGVYVGATQVSPGFESVSRSLEDWHDFGFQFTPAANGTYMDIRNNFSNSAFYVETPMLVDLTEIYGAGNEPTTEWCDSNLYSFINDGYVPQAVEPSAIEEWDYSIQTQTPGIEITSPVKAIEAQIFHYEAASETSEIYKGTINITGTQTVDIKFGKIAKNCTIEITGPDGVETSLVSSVIYAQAATLKIRSNGEVQIIITGNEVVSTESTYRLTSTDDMTLESADAETQEISNPLVTDMDLAKRLSSYAAYWYARRYAYSISWRQNPAIEVLDVVKVHDDFKNNRNVLLTENDLTYNTGVLSGSSKGVS